MYVEGSLRTRKWQDKEGQDRYTTEIRADAHADARLAREARRRAARRDPGDAPPWSRQDRASRSRAAAKKPAGKFDDMEDDIPF